MRHRFARPITMAAMLASSALLAGGVLVATAGPTSASNAGGGQTCTSLTGTVDLSAAVPVLTGTLSGCNSVGHNPGAISAVVDITGAPAPISILWASGNATTVGSITAAAFTGDCTAVNPADIPVTATITVGGGPFVGTMGTSVLCADITNFPMVTIVNNGPVKL
jgi:hypothetical protein